MLKLVKMEHKYAPQLFEMMDEWSAAKEKIIPWGLLANAIITTLKSI